MLIRRDRLPLHVGIPSPPIDPSLLAPIGRRFAIPYPLTRHHVQRGRSHRVAEEGNAIPGLVGRFPRYDTTRARVAAIVALGENDAVNSTP